MNITDTIGSLLQSKAADGVLTIAPEQTVYEALELMARHNIGALLVLAGGRVGIVGFGPTAPGEMEGLLPLGFYRHLRNAEATDQAP